MGDPDFFTRIAPWTRTTASVAPVTFAAAAVIPVLAVAPASGFSRWILGFSIAQEEGVAEPPLLLRTITNQVPICASGHGYSALLPTFNMLLTDPLNSTLELLNLGPEASTQTVWTLVFADTPPNVLSNTVLGSLAG